MATHHSSLSPEEVLGRRATLAGRAVPLRAGAKQKLPHQEPILEPELPICDPHHHFWDFRLARIPYQRYMMHELVLMAF